MIYRLLFVINFLVLQNVAFAQWTITVSPSGHKTTVSGPVLTVGANHLATPIIPYNTVAASDTFLYKGETEIVLGPDNIVGTNDEFYTTNYMTNSNGYFHAYLVPPINYTELKPELDADYVVTVENKINFLYIEKYDTAPLEYQIYDYRRAKKLTVFPLATPTMGSNYYSLDLSNTGLVNNTFYTLEVKNTKGEIGYVRFKYIKQE